MNEWGKFFRDNFDKILLVMLYGSLLFIVFHMAHEKVDPNHISWVREEAGTVIGALLGLITGAKLAAGRQDPPPPQVPPPPPPAK
jgi:hypothetical protein